MVGTPDFEAGGGSRLGMDSRVRAAGSGVPRRVACACLWRSAQSRRLGEDSGCGVGVQWGELASLLRFSGLGHVSYTLTPWSMGHWVHFIKGQPFENYFYP